MTIDLDLLSSIPGHDLIHISRAAPSGENIKDYTTLSVAVMTLGLILVVELIRHRLDHAATGRFFFKAVLNGVYQELATLGIVEFFIFLLLKYHTSLNINQEVVFADVHFTIFYTAIFNAFQSVILTFFTTRVSDHLWVRTEYQDLHHYLEIREEFERMGKILYGVSPDDDDDDDGNIESIRRMREDEARYTQSEPSYFTCEDFARLGSSLWRHVRHPVLARKYNNLLVQIRFHELKAHFLQANDLPPNFHVSDYLKRSEIHVLTRLVSVSVFAWLLLAGATNILYFLMGMVLVGTEGDLDVVVEAMSLVFIGSMIFYVVMSVVIFNKMRWIFGTMMEIKLITPKAESESVSEFATASTSKRSREVDQRSLFWGGNPKIIPLMVQLMQFGFAVGLGILLVFWLDIDKETSPYRAWNLLVVAVVCYAAFVFIMSQVIPRYTLCSSLGQLMNHKRLQESLAHYRLEEAKRKQLELKEERELLNNLDDDDDDDDDETEDGPSFGVAPIKTFMESVTKKTVRAGMPMSSDLLSALVQTSTSKLRSNLPLEVMKELEEKEQQREQRMRDRRNRRKAVSDGVATMRGPSFASPSQPPSPSISPSPSMVGLSEAKTTDSIATRKKRRRDRRKSNSESAIIEQMKNVTLQEKGRLTADFFASGNSSIFDGNASTKSPEPEPAAPEPHKSAATPNQSNFPRASVPPSLTGVLEEEHPSFGRIDSSFENEGNDQANGNGDQYPGGTKARPDETQTTGTDEASEGDESDADDVPAMTQSEMKKKITEPPKGPSLVTMLRNYFRGRRYLMTSAVFGTNVCFFFIAMRVETILIATGLLEDQDNTFHFTSEQAFWLEFTYFILFIIGDLIIISLFLGRPRTDTRGRIAFFSAIIDIPIVAMCFTLLIVAETRRCCNDKDDSHRFLAGEDDDKKEIIIECCPKFGTRLYSGVGDIEPFTSLIVLRLFRFLLAARIVRRMDFDYTWRNTTLEEAASGDSPFPLALDYNKQTRKSIMESTNEPRKAHKHISMEHESGTVVELWRTAVANYPEIVEEHGEFSSELLMTMLGLEVEFIAQMEETSEQSEEESVEENEPEQSTSGTVPSLKRPSVGSTSIGSSMRRSSAGLILRGSMLPPTRQVSTRRQVGLAKGRSIRASNTMSTRLAQRLTVDKKYADLSPEVQAIILSGKVGKHVQSKYDASIEEDHLAGSSRDLSVGGLPSWDSVGNIGHRSVVGSSKPKVEFDIAPEEETDEYISQFVAPNARLLRSMRRCDKKLLPLLDHWIAVDVVMTRFEIVYFEASEIDDMLGDLSPNDKIKKMKHTRQAVMATKGGKALRLRDVAYGRKVVGHQELDSVEIIHVERVLPHETPDDGDVHVVSDEYWRPKTSLAMLHEDHPPSRGERWSRVNEHRLKIKSKHDVLCLRFYSDLDCSEANPDRLEIEKDPNGKIFKNNAFQWCQTVARLCGTKQLHQTLDHFGDDNEEELRDYLVMVDPDHHGRGRKGKKSLVDSISKRALFENQRPNSLESGPPAKSFARRRPSSFDSSRTLKGIKPPPRPESGVRRAKTAGEAPPKDKSLTIEDLV